MSHELVHFPLTPEEQLTQLGEQYNYLQQNIDNATTEAEIDGYAVVESAINNRISELTAHAQTPGLTHNSENNHVIDLRAVEKFGCNPLEISGIKDIEFIEKTEPGASLLRDEDLRELRAFNGLSEPHPEAIDSFEFTTKDGARFRIIDISGTLSAHAREPFTSADKPSEYKQDMLTALLQEMVLYSASGYSHQLATVKAQPDVKYIARGSNRIYFKAVGTELAKPEQVDDADVPQRTFAYIGSCQKNKQAELYMKLFGVKMKI